MQPSPEESRSQWIKCQCADSWLHSTSNCVPSEGTTGKEGIQCHMALGHEEFPLDMVHCLEQGAASVVKWVNAKKRVGSLCNSYISIYIYIYLYYTSYVLKSPQIRWFPASTGALGVLGVLRSSLRSSWTWRSTGFFGDAARGICRSTGSIDWIWPEARPMILPMILERQPSAWKRNQQASSPSQCSLLIFMRGKSNNNSAAHIVCLPLCCSFGSIRILHCLISSNVFLADSMS